MKFSLLAIFAFSLIARAEPSPRPQVPIMGWSSWNHFRIHIDEVMIREQADAMVKSGMKDAGYRFINIDDGFFGGRDAEGNLYSYDLRFPSGMKSLADTIRAKGLKPGIYSEAGSNTCGSIYDNDPRGVGVGLFGHEEQDLRLMLVDWGYDFIKVDWCGGLRQKLSEQEQYTKISQIIRRLKPTAVFNVCRWEYPGDWVKDVADSWRISGDIEPTFESVLKIVDLCEPLWKHSGPGNFNDMDMLQVGRGMSETEDRTHFTMWCMMNSPLLAGNDLRAMTPATLAILTHPELIALNQDPLAYQARRLRDDGDTELWAKPLGSVESGEVAVTLLNRGGQPANISFNLAEIGIDAAAGYSLRDLWQRKTLATRSTNTVFTSTVPSHGVVVLRIKGSSLANSPLAVPRDLTWDNGAGTGQWNTSARNWTGNRWKNSLPDHAIFGNTGATHVALTEAITVQDITFNAPGFTVSGNTLTIGSDGETRITANKNASIHSILAGGLLRKFGAATLTLSARNTHGGTVIESGTLAVQSLADGGASGVGSSWLAIDNDGTLSYRGMASETSNRDLWINNTTGTRTIEVVDANATLTLTGGNGAITRSIRKAGAGTLILGKSITADASLVVDGGKLVLTTANSYTGDTTVLAGTLSLGNGSSNTHLADTANLMVAAGARLHLNYSGTDTVNALTVGGIAKPPGIYSSSNSTFITGPGTLTVLNTQVSEYKARKNKDALVVGPDNDDDQ
jgi:autotransporter-associated beta strand protein